MLGVEAVYLAPIPYRRTGGALARNLRSPEVGLPALGAVLLAPVLDRLRQRFAQGLPSAVDEDLGRPHPLQIVQVEDGLVLLLERGGNFATPDQMDQ